MLQKYTQKNNPKPKQPVNARSFAEQFSVSNHIPCRWHFTTPQKSEL